MKIKDLRAFFSAVTGVLEEVGLPQDASAWRDLLPLFEVKASANVSDLCKIIGTLELGVGNMNSSLEGIVTIAPSLQNLLASAGIKAGQKKRTIRDDLAEFIEAIKPFSAASSADFSRAVRDKLEIPAKPTPRKSTNSKADVLDAYLPRLEQSLGDERQFEEVFKTLKADKLVGAPEAKKLSRAFAKETARSKAHAFDLIWAHHASLMDSRAKAAATAGRTAG